MKICYYLRKVEVDICITVKNKSSGAYKFLDLIGNEIYGQRVRDKGQYLKTQSGSTG